MFTMHNSSGRFCFTQSIYSFIFLNSAISSPFSYRLITPFSLRPNDMSLESEYIFVRNVFPAFVIIAIPSHPEDTPIPVYLYISFPAFRTDNTGMPLLRNERPAVPYLSRPGELKPALAIHTLQ